MSKKQRVQALIFGCITMAALALVVMKPVEAAGTFIVSNTNDNGSGSLRQAIADANAAAGGTINFAAGVTGTIDLLTALPDLNSNITINGPGATMLTVERSFAEGTPNFRIFRIADSPRVSISGLTIKNGKAGGRGGAISNSGLLILTNCTVANSSAIAGGGIANRSFGSMAMTNCTVTNNSASTGGGIYNLESRMTITNCVVANNSADDGGGIGNTDSTMTVINSSIVHNSSRGIVNRESRLTLINCLIAYNSAASGGGIVNSFGILTLTNCTVANNSANTSGGITLNEGQATLTNCTVANNTAIANHGGGITNNFGSLRLQNTIVAKNTGRNPDVHGSIISLGHNLIGDTTGNSGGDLSQGDLLNVDPLFELDETGKPLLKDHGGATQTIALLCRSAAIDQGKNSSDLTTDQRGAGFARSYNDPAIANAIDGDGTDIGAFELQGCFDLCLQNEGSNASLQINSQTGDYRFCCSGQSYVGRGTVTIRGGMVTLQDNNGNRRFLARVDRASNRATASLQSPPGTMLCTISGRVNTNHSCRCVLPSAPQ